MAVAFRSMTTAGGGAATSVTNTPPAGLSDNDILVFVIYKENTNVVTFPAGFTEWFSRNASDTSFQMSVAWKRAASEAGNYVASWTGSVWADGVLTAYSGAITSGDPADATAVSQANGDESGQCSCPSITTATANAMRIAIGEVFIGLSGATPPSGMTERVDFDDTTVADQIQASAGASGAKVFSTGAVSGQTVGAQIALRENPTTSIPFGLRHSGPPIPWHMEL
jgi:hypothetical protein